MTTTASYSSLSCKALRIGARVASACQSSRVGQVHSCFERVVNIELDEELLALALPEAGGSSRFLTVRGLYPFEPGAACHFTPASVEIGAARYDVSGLDPWSGPWPAPSVGARSNAPDRPATLNERSAQRFIAALDACGIRPGIALTGPIEARTIGSMIGRGPGLTPSGDDMLLGFVAVYNEFGTDESFRMAFHKTLSSELIRTTKLSAQFLKAAVEHDYHESIQRLLLELSTQGSGQHVLLEEALQAVLAIGASSGRDTAEGMRQALLRIREEAASCKN